WTQPLNDSGDDPPCATEPAKDATPNVFRTVPRFGRAVGRPKPTVNMCIIRAPRPINSRRSKSAARGANSRPRASRVADRAQERGGRRIFQIDWKANPPIRRFGEKRQDQPEGEAGGDPDRHHDERFWKCRLDGRKRLVENGHIRKCQLALQLSLV